VSPRSKRLLQAAAQILLTAVALVVVFRLVRFHDAVVMRDGTVVAVGRAEVRGDWVVVTMPDGRIASFVLDSVGVERGLRSILRGTNLAAAGLLTAAMLVPFSLMAVRWRLILKAHGFDVGFGRVFLVNYAGIFFNHLLPGGVGGDAAKAVLAAEGEERKAALVGTVLLDRVIGLAVLVLLGAACLVPYVGRFPSPLVPAAVFGAAGGMLLGYLVYVNPALRRRLAGRVPFARALAPVDEVLRSFHARPRLTLATAGLSLFSQLASILIAYGLSRAMGLDRPPLWQFLVFEPVIFIGTALIPSMGGLGVQEGLYALLFGDVGGLDRSLAVALSLLFKAAQVAASVPGGLLFAFGFARRRP
jgi:hypothetical protein